MSVLVVTGVIVLCGGIDISIDVSLAISLRTGRLSICIPQAGVRYVCPVDKTKRAWRKVVRLPSYIICWGIVYSHALLLELIAYI